MNFTPLRDMILVKPDPEPQKIGSLHIPQGALPQGHLPGKRDDEFHDAFVGTVMAVGPGDLLRERRRNGRSTFKLINPDGSRAPMRTKVGDRVLYPRRPSSPGGVDAETGECAVYLEGEKYLLFHEEQSAFAVIEA